jgi:hypothetical protein
MNRYMRTYIKNSPLIVCEFCGNQYKAVYKYKHVRSLHHIQMTAFKERFQIPELIGTEQSILASKNPQLSPAETFAD